MNPLAAGAFNIFSKELKCLTYIIHSEDVSLILTRKLLGKIVKFHFTLQNRPPTQELLRAEFKYSMAFYAYVYICVVTPVCRCAYAHL